MTFNNEYAQIYDYLYQDKNYEEETEFIENIINEYAGSKSKILEIGCGTGEHAIRLNKLGHEILALDKSYSMIELARKKINNENGIKFKCSSHKEINEKFDVILMMFHVFSYFTQNNEIDDLFSFVEESLNNDGIFLFDFWFTDGVLNLGPTIKRKTIEANGKKIIRKATPEICNENIINVNYEVNVVDQVKNNSSSFEEIHSMRHFSISEIEKKLSKFGLKCVKTTSWMKSDLPTDNDWAAFMIVSKVL